MSQSKTLDDVRSLIAAALTDAQSAKPYRPEDNPLAHLELKDLVHGKGIDKQADHYPALDMAAKLAGLDGKRDDLCGIAHATDQARRDGLTDGKADKSAKRMAAARSRAARKAQIDAIADAPIEVNPERMAAAWAVVVPLSEIVDKIARSKRAWASRFLGSIADDIGQMALEKMALVLAKDDRDLTVLEEAARELGGIVARTGRVPGEQIDKAESKHRRQVAKGRKWLMGMANNRVMGALVDAYTSQRNLRWENIDLIATVMASINGAGEDPSVANAKASKAPVMMGTRMTSPGAIDSDWLSEVVTAAITCRGLDRLVELFLDDDRRRTDGAFKWTENAEAIFLASPDDDAAWLWSQCVLRTEPLANPGAARAEFARNYARSLFEFMPSVIYGAVEAFDYQARQRTMFGFGTTRNASVYASLTSDFDELRERHDGPREVLRPALTYATAADAAAAIGEVLGVLLTGQDVARSIAFA